MIPGAIGIVSNLITAYVVQKTKRKSPVLFVASLFPLAAAVALYELPHTGTAENNRKLLAVYFILQVYQCITPIIFTWAFANTAGHTKKTTTTGVLYIGLTVGNIVGPQVCDLRLRTNASVMLTFVFLVALQSQTGAPLHYWSGGKRGLPVYPVRSDRGSDRPSRVIEQAQRQASSCQRQDWRGRRLFARSLE